MQYDTTQASGQFTLTQSDNSVAYAPDVLTLATSAYEEQRLQKVIGGGMSDLPHEFYFQTATVEGIDDLHEILSELRGQPRRCVLRGAPIRLNDAPQRRLVKARTENGLHYPATLADVPRAWIMLDLDSLEEPAGMCFKDEPGACATHVRELLPQPFRTARCVWRTSGSAGFKPGIRLHLWFLLNRPLTGAQCEAWLADADVAVDSSMFRAVQLHFTADPDLAGNADPMSSRIGKLDGAVEYVRVPAHLPEAAPRPRSQITELRPRPERAAEADLTGLDAALETTLARLAALDSGRVDGSNKAGSELGVWLARAELNDPDTVPDMADELADQIADAAVTASGNEDKRAKYKQEASNGLEFGRRQARMRLSLRGLRGLINRPVVPVAPANDTHREKPAARRRFEFRSTAQLFSVKPPKMYACPALQLGAGRTNIFVGRAGSLKTWAVQDLALAVATGSKAWGRHDVSSGVVVHIDHEMGEDIERRYTQLARGRGIVDPKASLDGKLRVAVMPSIYLTQDDAEDAYVDAATGAKLVVIDSLMAACAGIDENDSRARMYIDLLTRVSEKTGACVVVLHHAGKGGTQGTKLNMARGSSALMDAAGCVLNFERIGETDKVDIAQAKAAGGPFISDQQISLQTHGAGGLQVRGTAAPTKSVAATERDEADKAKILDLLALHPKSSLNRLEDRASLNKRRLGVLLDDLERDGRVVNLPGLRNAREYSLTAIEAERRRCR
jgi:hypothetical protein